WPASLVAWRSASLKYAGTVMTASVTGSPRYSSASRFSLPRMRAESSCAEYFLSSISTDQSVPMWRLTDAMVRSTLVTAWRLAISPTRTSPVLENATTEGVVRAPSAFAMTVGSPPSRTETTELVVPRSIPTARAMCGAFFRAGVGAGGRLRMLSLLPSSLRRRLCECNSTGRNLSAMGSPPRRARSARAGQSGARGVVGGDAGVGQLGRVDRGLVDHAGEEVVAGFLRVLVQVGP